MSDDTDLIPLQGRTWWIGAFWLLIITAGIVLLAWWVNRQRP